MMDKERQHSLRKKLDTRIISLVKPEGMSLHEYRIACDMENLTPTVENGQYLHWLITAGKHEDSDIDIAKKVYSALVHAIEKKYLIDVDNIEQQSYFCDAIKDICLKDRELVTKLLEAVLKNYKGTVVFDFCKRLNKMIGFTPIEYFNYDGFVSLVKEAQEKAND